MVFTNLQMLYTIALAKATQNWEAISGKQSTIDCSLKFIHDLLHDLFVASAIVSNN